MKTNSVVEVFLRYAGVPYTQYGLRQRLENHPHRSSLWGVGNVLADYGIVPKCIQTNAERLRALGKPVVAVLAGAVVLLTRIGTDTVEYATKANEHEAISIDQFIEQWDGVALVLEVSERSREEGYVRNKVEQAVAWCKLPISIGLLLYGVWWLFNVNRPSPQSLEWVLLGLYLIGAVASFWGVRQSLGWKPKVEKKLCAYGSKVSCTLWPHSKQVKLFGTIDWSVVGLGYFSACLILLLLGQYDVLFLAAVAALPYTVWSIWYQWRRAKQWCVLCVCLQVLLWGLFFVLLSFGVLRSFSLTWHSALVGAIALVVPALVLWWAVPTAVRSLQLTSVQSRWSDLKTNETVFSALLAQQPRLALAPAARNIVLGNPCAGTVITVVNNPYCGHCADLYLNVLQRLLFLRRNQIRIELLFVGEPEMQNEIKSLLSLYFRYDADRVEELYAEWFETHQPIVEPYMLDRTAHEQIDWVYQAQNQWRDRNVSKGTPAVYFNSMLLPNHYNWQDLEHIV